jgi:hypothetical protein
VPTIITALRPCISATGALPVIADADEMSSRLRIALKNRM